MLNAAARRVTESGFCESLGAVLSCGTPPAAHPEARLVSILDCGFGCDKSRCYQSRVTLAFLTSVAARRTTLVGRLSSGSWTRQVSLKLWRSVNCPRVSYCTILHQTHSSPQNLLTTSSLDNKKEICVFSQETIRLGGCSQLFPEKPLTLLP